MRCHSQTKLSKMQSVTVYHLMLQLLRQQLKTHRSLPLKMAKRCVSAEDEMRTSAAHTTLPYR